MSAIQNLLLIAVLIAASALLSLAEMSMAASRRLKLQQMSDEGDARAGLVLAVQEAPGDYFTVIQIGQNAIAILGGIVGEGAFSPLLNGLLTRTGLVENPSNALTFTVSFILVTSLFIVLSDLFPKRLGMARPEDLAVRLVGPMQRCRLLLAPLVWLYSHAADALLRLLGLPATRDDRITPDDILALTEAGAQAGVLDRQEQQVIANVFELDTRPVTSAMTPRERIAWFRADDGDALVRTRIAAEPFSTYPVCEGEIDHVIGYVDAKDLFQRALNGQPIQLTDPALLHRAVVLPDRLSLGEVLEHFRQALEDFAIVVNEYSLVVGVVTLNDVMSTVMGDLVAPDDDAQMVRRDADSWLVDGATPLSDIQRALGLTQPWPHAEEVETLSGFLMVVLRRIPKRTDHVDWCGWRFEVMDVDSFRVDQVLVTRHPPDAATGLSAPTA